MFDFGMGQGDPDIGSTSPDSRALCATSQTGSYSPSGGLVGTGVWYAFPSECGPYSSTAPSGSVSSTMTVITRPFDSAVTSPTGDLMLNAVSPGIAMAPVLIEPGKSATIDVTITPSGVSGSVVSGTLYVDAIGTGTPNAAYEQFAADEMAGLPYTYTIK
jgi:hypothetical protein